jgi:4-amino-4-deoxychorismate lyase
VTAEGARTLFSEESPAIEVSTALSISPIRVGSANWDARFKTVSYLSHIQAWKTAATAEVVLLNEWGHVASASRGNIFWRRGDRLFTPDHEAGCRCGVVRGFVLKQNQVEMGHFASTELLEADEIFLTNSMKGIVSVNEIGRRVLTEFPHADELRGKYAAAIASQLER